MDLVVEKNKELHWQEHSLKRVNFISVSYTHLRAHETVLDLVCRLLLEKKQKYDTKMHTRTQNVISTY